MAGRSETLVLSAGGLGSLVALAMAKADRERAGGRLAMPALVYVHDGRESGRQRLEHAQQQADFYGVDKVHELALTHLHGAAGGHGPERGADGATHEPLASPQLLLAGLSLARRARAKRLVWAVCRGGDAAGTARALEQATLVQHVLEASVPSEAEATGDASGAVRLETPFVELTGSQLLDLGQRAEASWGLAWSCLLPGASACGACAGCRRRRRAFETAGLVDPTSGSPGGVREGGRRRVSAA